MNLNVYSKHYALASILVIALLAVTPAFADADRDASHAGDRGFGIGALLKSLHDTRTEDLHATSTNNVSVSGTVTAMSGTTITLMSAHGGVYTINAASATIKAGSNTALTLADVRVGDALKVKGTLSGSVITASSIKDKTIASREALTRFNGVRAGEVTAIGTNTITLDRFGTGSTNVITSGSTFYAVNGSATTSAAVKVGSNLLVFGPTTISGSNDSITASVVLILDSSVKFLQHVFNH